MPQEDLPVVQWSPPVDGLSLGIEVPQHPFLFTPVVGWTGPIIIRQVDSAGRIVQETSNAGGHWDSKAIVRVHLKNNSAKALFWSESPAVWSVSFSAPNFEQPPPWYGQKPPPLHGEPICLNPAQEAVMTLPMSRVFDIWPSVPRGNYTVTVSYSPNELLKYARGGEGNWTHPFDVPGFWTGTVATPAIVVRVEHPAQPPTK